MQSFKVRFRLYDLLFYLLLVFSFYYTRNIVCRLMMVAFFGYTILRMIVEKREVPIPFFYVSFFSFVLYGGASILWGNVIDAQIARTMVTSLALNFLMIFSIVEYVYMSESISRVLRVTELGIFSTAFVVTMLSLPTITQGRLGTATEMNGNVLAILCVYGFMLTMYLQKNGQVNRCSSWLRMLFYVAVILLSGSRKGFVMIVMGIVFIQFVDGKKSFFKKLLVGIGVATVLYVLIMNVSVLYNIMGVRIESALNALVGEGATTEASLKDRQNLVETGMWYIRKKPWTGYGYDCFKLISGRGANGKVDIGDVGFYSHNNYIELLFSGGIVALVLYYIGILDLLIKLLRKLRKDICVRYLLALMVSKLSIEYYYVSCFERVDAYILAIVVGCVLVVDKNQDRYSKEFAIE